ncbi:MAG: hypothetical protein V1758_10540 [Pseudomonadota bacterium]
MAVAAFITGIDTDNHQGRDGCAAVCRLGCCEEVIISNHEELVAAKVFADLSFQVVDDDHFLHKTL